MGRLAKTGLDYFPTDVDIFNDEKIEFISAKFGLEGEAVLFRLLARIYRNGYFMEWNEDVKTLFISKLKSRAEDVSKFIDEILEECFKRDFFSRDKFEAFGILTSRGIQRRYLKICQDAKRKNIPFEINYGFINIYSEEKGINSELTPINSEFSTQRKEKERKEKERKEKERKEKEETKTPEEKTCSNFETPNFEDKETLTRAIKDLFFNYADRTNLNFEAEIKPILEAVFDKREGLTPQICWKEITDSFIIMKQKQKTNTDFLLGIIRNKLNTKFAALQENKTRISQIESNRIRAQTMKEEYIQNQKIIAENNKKLQNLFDFFKANKSLFTRDEKDQIKKYLNLGLIEKVEIIIAPKLDEINL